MNYTTRLGLVLRCKIKHRQKGKDVLHPNGKWSIGFKKRPYISVRPFFICDAFRVESLYYFLDPADFRVFWSDY